MQTIVDNHNVAITGQAEWYPVAFFHKLQRQQTLAVAAPVRGHGFGEEPFLLMQGVVRHLVLFAPVLLFRRRLRRRRCCRRRCRSGARRFPTAVLWLPVLLIWSALLPRRCCRRRWCFSGARLLRRRLRNTSPLVRSPLAAVALTSK
jgi:hypothetical protein